MIACCALHARRDGAKVWCDNLGTAPLAAHAVADIGGTAAGAFCPPPHTADLPWPMTCSCDRPLHSHWHGMGARERGLLQTPCVTLL